MGTMSDTTTLSGILGMRWDYENSQYAKRGCGIRRITFVGAPLLVGHSYSSHMDHQYTEDPKNELLSVCKEF